VLQGLFSQSALRSASLLVQEKATRHGWCGGMPGHQGHNIILTNAHSGLLEITTGLANIGGSSVLARSAETLITISSSSASLHRPR
jgi:hypothetical protein